MCDLEKAVLDVLGQEAGGGVLFIEKSAITDRPPIGFCNAFLIGSK